MPKPIRVTVDIEESFFGKIYRTLDTMPGVAAIAIHSEGVKGNGVAKPRQKKGGTQSVPCLLLGALIQTPGLTREQVIPILEASGKKGSSLPDALTKLKKAGHIKIKGAGKAGASYTVTAAGKKHYQTACQIEQGAA